VEWLDYAGEAPGATVPAPSWTVSSQRVAQRGHTWVRLFDALHVAGPQVGQ